MAKLTAVLSVTFFWLIIQGPAGACILTYDDITAGTGASVDTYGGLVWTNTSVIHKDTEIFGIVDHGYNNGVVSGNYVAMNDYGLTATVSHESGLFDFNGVYLTATWNDGLNITAAGELNGVEIYSRTVTVDTTSPTWFDFSFDPRAFYVGLDIVLRNESCPSGLLFLLGWREVVLQLTVYSCSLG